MSDSNIESVLQELENKIGDDNTSKSDKMHNFSIKPMYIYGGVPVIILLSFLLVRPNFIKKKDEKTGNDIIDMKKVLITTLIFSIIIDISIYVYMNKKK